MSGTQSPLEMGATLIRLFEGFSAEPYPDSGGTWTIGYGTVIIDGKPVTADTPSITVERAEELMISELSPKAASVDKAVPADATDNQRAAVYSFAYNEGLGAFLKSTLLRLWKSGDVQGAADEFRKWVYCAGRKLGGLVNRREVERAVFLGTVTV